MVFAVVVQARLGSTRLPGKVLEPLGGRSALARCLERCARIRGVDEVVCAIPDGSRNDPVEDEAKRAGARVVRGPEQDVLARYALAAKQSRADLVMRVTSDCPVIDPAVCARVRDLMVSARADYACNNMPPRYPHGLDCDVFPAERLYEAEWLAKAAFDREHVTPWLRREPGLVRAAMEGPGQGVERLRWTLDHPEDLAFFQALFQHMGDAAATASWTELAAFCLRRPDVTSLNAMHVDEARLVAASDAHVFATEDAVAAKSADGSAAA